MKILNFKIISLTKAIASMLFLCIATSLFTVIGENNESHGFLTIGFYFSFVWFANYMSVYKFKPLALINSDWSIRKSKWILTNLILIHICALIFVELSFNLKTSGMGWWNIFGAIIIAFFALSLIALKKLITTGLGFADGENWFVRK